METLKIGNEEVDKACKQVKLKEKKEAIIAKCINGTAGTVRCEEGERPDTYPDRRADRVCTVDMCDNKKVKAAHAADSDDKRGGGLKEVHHAFSH